MMITNSNTPKPSNAYTTLLEADGDGEGVGEGVGDGEGVGAGARPVALQSLAIVIFCAVL